MSDVRELAELISPETYCICVRPNPDGGRCACSAPLTPAYDTDLNDMRDVWKVLKEKGLWDEFYLTWEKGRVDEWEAWIDDCNYSAYWHFLNDLPGQVKAAIQVLKEAKG